MDFINGMLFVCGVIDIGVGNEFWGGNNGWVWGEGLVLIGIFWREVIWIGVACANGIDVI